MTLTRRLLLVGSAAVLPDMLIGSAKGKRPKKKSKRKPKSPDKLLAALAASHTHGDTHDGYAPETILDMIEAGQRVYCRCGYIAAAGVLACKRRGIPARLVGAFTRLPWDGRNDGHVMLEANNTLYDLTGNRRAPHGVGIVEQVSLGSNRVWVPLADDPVCATECDILADMRQFDERIFQVPWIAYHGSYCFHDVERDRWEARGFVYVNKKQWHAIKVQHTAPSRKPHRKKKKKKR